MLSRSLLGLLLFVLAPFAYSGTTPPNCDPILQPTLPALVERASARQQELKQALPPRTFVDPNIDRHRVEDGVSGPRALADLHAPHTRFQSIQAPFPETPAVLKLDVTGNSVALRIHVNFKGQKIRTTAYTNLPGAIREQPAARNGQFIRSYIVGPEHKETGVIYWMHGGGTPTATGVNGVSVGFETGKRNIPVIAIDGPGHGNSDLFPFTSGQEILDYHLQVMRETIHPEVPVIVMGHSWGGQFALQMHLMWPKLRHNGIQVTGFLSLAPPADVSLGGSTQDKFKKEKQLDACYHDWAERIAESDFEFIENTVRNGKTSPVAALYCTVSALDYTWKLPTDGQARPRLMVIVGENDGLVYTGREELFKTFLEKLIPPEDFVVLKPGRTHKNEKAGNNRTLIKTGHNIFDRYLEESDRLQMADFLGAEVSKETVAEAYARISYFVQQQIKRPLPKLTNQEPDRSPQGLIDSYYRLWANNLAFREFVDSFSYFDFKRTDQNIELQKRRIELNQFIRQAESERAKAKKNEEEKIEAEIANLLKTAGVKSLTLAKKELEISQSPSRTTELQNFLTIAIPVKEKVRSSFVDTSADEILKLESRPHDIGSLEEANTALLQAQKDPKRKKELERFILEARQINNQNKARLGSEISIALAAIQSPKGIKSIDDAQWELSLDRSPERQRLISGIVQSVEALLSQREQRIQNAVQAATDRVPIEGQKIPFEQASQELEMIKQIIEARYVDRSSPDQEDKTSRLVQRMSETSSALNQAKRVIELTRQELKSLREKRNALKKEIDTLIDPNRYATEIVELIGHRERALESYVEANKKYDLFVSDQLAKAYESGTLTSQTMDTLFKDTKPYSENYLQARSQFLSANRAVEKKLKTAAIRGELGKEILALAHQLYGRDGKGGVESQVNTLLKRRDSELEIRANLLQEAFALRKKYHELIPGYFNLERQDLKSLLAMPYIDLIQLLEDKNRGVLALETLKAGLKEFDDMWAARDVPEKRGADLN